MKYITYNNQPNIDINETHLQGYVYVNYNRLEKVFGKPTDGDRYKTDAQWGIQFEDGSVATIYNWKNGKNFCGKEGIPINEINKWNIGGHDISVVEKIKLIVKF